MEQLLESMVKDAPSADALKALVASIRQVPGSDGRIYTAEELLERIDLAIRFPATLGQVTRSYGLRAKVRALIAESC